MTNLKKEKVLNPNISVFTGVSCLFHYVLSILMYLKNYILSERGVHTGKQTLNEESTFH